MVQLLVFKDSQTLPQGPCADASICKGRAISDASCDSFDERRRRTASGREKGHPVQKVHTYLGQIPHNVPTQTWGKICTRGRNRRSCDLRRHEAVRRGVRRTAGGDKAYDSEPGEGGTMDYGLGTSDLGHETRDGGRVSVDPPVVPSPATTSATLDRLPARRNLRHSET